MARTSVHTGVRDPLANVDPVTGDERLIKQFHVMTTAIVLTAALVPGMPTASAGECPQTESSWGFGGQEADCWYTCVAGDNVHLRVESADEDAGVKGSTRCGSANLKCGWTLEACGADGQTSTTQLRGAICRGESREFYDSSLTVDCWAEGGTPAPCFFCPGSDPFKTWTSGEVPIPDSVTRWSIRLVITADSATAFACTSVIGCGEIPTACGIDDGIRTCIAVI